MWASKKGAFFLVKKIKKCRDDIATINNCKTNIDQVIEQEREYHAYRIHVKVFYGRS